tara:strand:+ start:730 stop:897 length:168 start_codon:yes stop_codon:yes gene_type:complete
MELILWFAAFVPVIVGHFAAKYLAKVAGNESESFYAEAFVLFLFVQYGAYFIGAY